MDVVIVVLIAGSTSPAIPIAAYIMNAAIVFALGAFVSFSAHKILGSASALLVRGPTVIEKVNKLVRSATITLTGLTALAAAIKKLFGW